MTAALLDPAAKDILRAGGVHRQLGVSSSSQVARNSTRLSKPCAGGSSQ
jgi:hypothetical protein|tara:strand:+ start:2602 stop:2748 length:147 start_codon:yes stop_codon:yes gene_type:complete